MNRFLISFAFTLSMVAVALPASATGVPTVDAANLIQLRLDAAAQVTQAADALKTAKDGIDQVRSQYNDYKGIVTGNDKLGNFLNNPALNKVLPVGDWAGVYSSVQDIVSLRKRYGLISSDATVQEKFDRILAGMDALERTYDASSARLNNAEQLRARLNEVQTPQEKADLQLRYSQELLEQQNTQMRMVNMQMLQEKQADIEEQKRQQDFLDKNLR